MKIKKIDWTPWTFLGPYIILFLGFIVIPVVAAIYLSFTYFNAIQAPSFIGLS